MQLSLRLSAIAEMVTEGNRLVDVGCDHGYLPVYLIFEKRFPRRSRRCGERTFVQSQGAYSSVWTG